MQEKIFDSEILPLKHKYACENMPKAAGDNAYLDETGLDSFHNDIDALFEDGYDDIYEGKEVDREVEPSDVIEPVSVKLHSMDLLNDINQVDESLLSSEEDDDGDHSLSCLLY